MDYPFGQKRMLKISSASTVLRETRDGFPTAAVHFTTVHRYDALRGTTTLQSIQVLTSKKCLLKYKEKVNVAMKRLHSTINKAFKYL